MKKIIIILGVVGAALSAIFVRMSTLPSVVLVFYRMVFAAIGIAPVLVIGSRSELKNLTFGKIKYCIVSGICLGLHFIFYFESLAYTSIASSVVLVDTEIFFVAIASIFFFREKQTWIEWLAIGITFVGSVVVAGGDLANGNIVGDLLALAGAVFVSIYTMIGRKARKDMSTTVYTSIVYSVAAVVALVFTLVRGYPLAIEGVNNWIAALGIAAFCTLLGHSIFSWGLKYEKASFVAIAKLLEPVFASILGLLIYREIPGLASCLGGVLIIAGICIYSQKHKEKS